MGPTSPINVVPAAGGAALGCASATGVAPKPIDGETLGPTTAAVFGTPGDDRFPASMRVSTPADRLSANGRSAAANASALGNRPAGLLTNACSTAATSPAGKSFR